MNLPERPPVALPKHFYSLDALRGLAALGVVFWHWQHFFYQGTELGPMTTARLPLYALFKPFYLNGARAVDLFFCLSGFIFFWLYADTIRRRETSWKEFAVLRFSRLYPLHLATLLFVGVGQHVLRACHGAYFVYPDNDLYHFVLQLFLASNWGFQDGNSFNYPIWSVSVEVLCYAVFFVVCLLNSYRWWHVLLFVGAGFFLQTANVVDFGKGVFSFFIGGLVFHLFTRMVRASPSRLVLQGLGAFTVALWIFIPDLVRHDTLYHFYKAHVWRAGFNALGGDVVGVLLRVLDIFAFELMLFPVTILTLALWETRRGTLGRRLAPLGHISYSTYLLHFPLQLVFFSVALFFAVPRTFFYTPRALGLFFLVLIPLALASYWYFERPCQSWLRARLLPGFAGASRRAAAAPPPGPPAVAAGGPTPRPGEGGVMVAPAP